MRVSTDPDPSAAPYPSAQEPLADCSLAKTSAAAVAHPNTNLTWLSNHPNHHSLAASSRPPKHVGAPSFLVTSTDFPHQAPMAFSSNTSPAMTSEDPNFPTRRLVTVRRIASIKPFNSVHNVLTLDGWTVATKKGQDFQIGEYVVFVEVDAFLPATSSFAPLFRDAFGHATVFNGQKGYRALTREIKNHKPPMTQAISQGLVFKLDSFPDIKRDVLLRRAAMGWVDDFAAIMREVDYSAQLGVTKWESERDPATGNWPIPSFIKKTDIERVQNCPNLFIKPKYRHFVFQESVKLDGRSMTCYFVHRCCHLYPTLQTLGPNYEKRAVFANGRFGVCSKACELSNAVPNPYWDTALELRLHQIMSDVGKSIAIQGELVGWNIQGNPYNYPENKREFFVYSVVDVETRERWHPEDVKSFADDHGLKHVEVIGYSTLRRIANSHQDLLDRADKSKGEGLVFKCCNDNRWFKVLSSKYIIKKGDEARAVAEEKARAVVKDIVVTQRAPGQLPKALAPHFRKPVAETKHVAAPVSNNGAQADSVLRPQAAERNQVPAQPNGAQTKNTTQAHTSTRTLAPIPRLLENKPVSLEDAASLARKTPKSTETLAAIPRSLEKRPVSFEEAAGLISNAPISTRTLVVVPSSPEKRPVSFKEAAGLITQASKEADAVQTTQQSGKEKVSSVPCTAPAPAKEEALVVKTAQQPEEVKQSLVSFPTLAPTKEEAPVIKNSEKQDALSVPSRYNPRPTTPNIALQPVVSAANSPTQAQAQPIKASARTTPSPAREPGYYKMNRADFNHFTETCFSAENVGANHAWLENWSADYFKAHAKPTTFDSTGNATNATKDSAASSAQATTPAANNQTNPAGGSRRWTNSRLRHSRTGAPAPPPARKADDTPNITITPEASQVYTTTKKSITLTSRDADGKLVQAKLTIKIKTGAAPPIAPNATATSQDPGAVPDLPVAPPRPDFPSKGLTSAAACPTGVAPPSTDVVPRATSPAHNPAASIPGAPSHGHGTKAARPDPAALLPSRPAAAVVQAPLSDPSRPGAVPPHQTDVPAAALAVPAPTVPVAAAAAATGAAMARGGEQTMTGRYRDFAEWLGIGPGREGVDDVRQF